MTQRVRAEVTVRAPPDDVFAFLDDLSNVRVLTPEIVEVRNVEPLENGGRRIEFTTRGRDGALCGGVSEHVERVPGRRVVVRADLPGVTTVAARELEPVAAGTRLRAVVAYSVRVRLLGRLIELQWRRPTRKRLETVLGDIKTAVERGQP